MELQGCNDMRNELTDWQMKLDKIVEKLDAAPSGDKGKILPQITNMHILREELKDRIESLKGECNVLEEQERRRIDEEICYVMRPVIPSCGCCC